MTLEKGKHYGQEQMQQTLQDKARTRLNNPAPHQAPQRERVSRAAIPGNRGSATPRRRAGARTWKGLLRPDVNMGVPQLMLILEPNIVWEHTQAYVSAVGKEVEASVTPGEFFDGWHKGGRRAHGCYEGSYWELLGDCEELAELLRKLSKAPQLLEEAPLELPPPPELPKWEEFKPNLHVIPAAPSLPPLKLPPFRAPILETDVPFLEPQYLPLPTVPPAPKEEPVPTFVPPEFLEQEPLKEPAYVAPPRPVLSEAPRAPQFGEPKHGHDWTGDRPFQLDLPDRDSFLRMAAARKVMDTSRWVHPPAGLPLLPELDPLDVDLLAGLDLEPIPRIELAWMGGPEPDPPYASVPTPPATLSRQASRAPSRAPSRPTSALPARTSSPPRFASPSPLPAGSPLPSTGPSPAPSRPRSAVGTPPAVPSLPLSAAGPAATDSGAASPAPEPSATEAPGSARPLSSRHRSGSRLGSTAPSPRPAPATPEEAAWEEARSVASEASGTPRVWVNFNAPFADLPPIMLPPRPEPGPEPVPEDFPHEPLEELPAFVAPTPLPEPVYEAPPAYVPAWASPTEPRPVGFLRGTAPVVICDVSGTMHPRQQGQFRQMKKCAVELLDPEGEIATAAGGFDVITFCGSAWAWSAGYGERMGLLQSSQVLYAGRQVGGRHGHAPRTASPARAGSPGRHASPSRAGSPARNGTGGTGGGAAPDGPVGPSLMPVTAELLSDAQRWLANWPDAVGQTKMATAFRLADQLGGAADCWYILSDGLAHDQQACVDFLARRAMEGLPLPVIHTVGFIPADASADCAGERFLRALADMTGGSYQRYSPDLVKVWVPGKGFVKHDFRAEAPQAAEERKWAEAQLRAERRKNLRLGIVEPIEVTMERVAALHATMRVAPALRANEAAAAESIAAHAAALEAVRAANAAANAEAEAAHAEAVEAARERNQERVDAAREAFLAVHGDWEADYLHKLNDWEEANSTLEAQREEAMAAMAAQRPGSGAISRPRSGLPSRGPSRPTSASIYAQQRAAALEGSQGGAGPGPGRPQSAASPRQPSPRRVPSEARAVYAAAEYDAAYALDAQGERLASGSSSLSPMVTPPGSRPVSGVPGGLGARATSGSPPRSASSRPRSAKPASAGGGGGSAGGGWDEGGGGAAEYLESIAEDLAEASAPLDAFFTGGTRARGGAGGARGAQTAPGEAAAEGGAGAEDTLDDDGLDVVPPGRGGRAGRGSAGQRDQDGGRRRSSAASTSASASARPLSAELQLQPGAGSAGGGRSSGASSAGRDRPLSGRASGGPAASTSLGGLGSRRGSAGPPSARSRPLSGGGGYSGYPLAVLPEGSALPPPPPLPEPSAPLAPLPGEGSEEFKRRILPPEVVAELDETNAARLGEIRDAWDALIAADAAANAGRRTAALARNAAKLAGFREAVYDAYAEGLVRDVVFGGAVRVAANLALLDGAEAAFQAELARVQAENERLRAAHGAEVADKAAREEAAAAALARWQAAADEALGAWEAEKARARAAHDANVERLRAEWAEKKKEIDDLNSARLAEAEAMHEALCEAVREANRQHKAEHTELLRQRKEVENTNLSKLAEAKAAHKVRLEARATQNERLVAAAREEHQALCVRLGEEYEEARATAEADHGELCAFLRQANDQLTDEARRRYQEAIQELKEAHEAECAELAELHAEELERIRAYNTEIWPKVHVARLAQAELARVQAFAEHIRFCANKFEMGVNLLPNTPNYDRVVEMQALTEALAKAFPDLAPTALPWPDHERRLEPGTGWVAAPHTRPLTYRDPAETIARIAAGKPPLPPGGSGSPPRSPHATTGERGSRDGRGEGAGASYPSASGPLPSGLTGEDQAAAAAQYAYLSGALRPPAGGLQRPLSAGRARFASVLAEGGSGRPGSAGGVRASEAWAVGPSGGSMTAAGAGGGLQLRPMSGGGPGGYANPSAWRRSTTAAVALRASSPRGPGGAPTLGSLAAAAAAAATSNMAQTGRPLTARPYSSGGAGSGPQRPRSAGPAPRPARVAVDTVPLAAAAARSRAQAGPHALPPSQLAGFSRDVPKLRYPEVDVQQPLTVAMPPPARERSR
ncbi:hypothetical protein HYH03_005861 [Edaphochlamys debaryana]|uniref:Uncharacterized protein n=1 Tax=Edaphochlamys debaryana TaxID=47281 RepID=A0A835Y4G7_9CHLO|nr:hypothetical protein HYH03_005861 [Edaphochlamys debaryana]|eukprot:KAG2495930.1 hypothetical protein HYH03_005861 [Edaphochlamys debaryana]